MRKLFLGALLFALGAWIGHAQTALNSPWQVGVPNASTHTACTVTTGLTQMCLASDGMWISVNGTAYVQVQTGTPVAGVTSITVNGGVAQTGPVALTIPTKAISTTTSSTTTTIQ